MATLLKRILGGLGIPILVGALFIYITRDEALHPEFHTLFSKPLELVEDQKNGMIAIAGLIAPAGKDVHAFGSKRKQSNLERARIDLILLTDDAPPPKGALTYKEPYPISLNISEPTICPSSNTTNNSQCIECKQVKHQVKLNEALLGRYKSLYQYRYYENHLLSGIQPELNLLIDLNTLQVAA
ncbi:MAG: hypothetical protein P8P30_11055 [Rickettsiales bacterium]|nr:hypothetical protein [Rickettsiales bacterium]